MIELLVYVVSHHRTLSNVPMDELTIGCELTLRYALNHVDLRYKLTST